MFLKLLFPDILSRKSANLPLDSYGLRASSVSFFFKSTCAGVGLYTNLSYADKIPVFINPENGRILKKLSQITYGAFPLTK